MHGFENLNNKYQREHFEIGKEKNWNDKAGPEKVFHGYNKSGCPDKFWKVYILDAEDDSGED